MFETIRAISTVYFNADVTILEQIAPNNCMANFVPFILEHPVYYNKNPKWLVFSHFE